MRGRTYVLVAVAAGAMVLPAAAGAQLADPEDTAAVENAVDPVIDRGPGATLQAGQPAVSGGRVRAVAVFRRVAGVGPGQVRIGLYRAAPGAAVGRRVILNSVRFARGGSSSIRVPVSAVCVKARRPSLWFVVTVAGYQPRAGAATVRLRATSRSSLLPCNRG